MSDANRVALSYEQENSTYGTVDSPTAMQDMRFTGETIVHENNTVSSAEIRSDRQVADVTRTGISVSGETNHELSFSTFDDWLTAGLLSAAFSSEVAGIEDTTTSVAASTGVYTTDGTAWGTTPAVGDIIYISGASNAANNGFKVVTASSSTTITVAQTGTAAEATASLAIDILADISNGTTFASFHIQRQYTDLTNIFALFTGMVINGFTLNIALESIITLSFTWTGKAATSPAPSSTFSARSSATTNPIMNAVDNVPTFAQGSTLADLDITAFTMAVANNARALSVIGTLGPTDVGLGKCDVTGTLQLYFENNTMIDLYTGDTATELMLVVQDSASDGYVIYLPQVKLATGANNATGQDTDVIADFTYIAYRDATYDYTVRIAKFTN